MLSDNLKKLRLERGMSQEELAEKLNVVKQTVSKWEKGLSMPDADMLIKLSATLGVTAGELLDEKSALKNNIITGPKEGGYGVLKAVGKVLLGILICYFIFLIIQTVFGLGVSLDTETTDIITKL